MKKQGIDWLAVFALCTAMLVWASSFIALKSSIGPLGPMSVIFGRMAIASLCFLYFLKQFSRLSFDKKDIKYIALMVLFEPCLYFIFEAKALQLTTAGQAGMITSMMPLITAIGAGIVLKEVITKRLLLGSFLAVVGAVWLSLAASSNEGASDPLLGNMLEFFAMICGAGYAISIRYLSHKFSAIFLTAIQSFVGAVFFLPFAIWEYYNVPVNITTNSLLWVAYLGVVVTLGGYGMFNFALGRIEASKASVYVNLIPVFAMLMAYVVLGERLGMLEFIASGIILLGVFISQVPKAMMRRLVRVIYSNK